jgi:hypothetical protein
MRVNTSCGLIVGWLWHPATPTCIWPFCQRQSSGDWRLSVEVLLNCRQNSRRSVVCILVVLCSGRSHDDRPSMPLKHDRILPSKRPHMPKSAANRTGPDERQDAREDVAELAPAPRIDEPTARSIASHRGSADRTKSSAVAASTSSAAQTSATISRRESAGRSASGSWSTVKRYARPAASVLIGRDQGATYWLPRALLQTASNSSAVSSSTENSG